MTKYDRITHGKANKGLGALRGIVSRFNFTHGGYERSPRLTAGPFSPILK